MNNSLFRSAKWSVLMLLFFGLVLNTGCSDDDDDDGDGNTFVEDGFYAKGTAGSEDFNLASSFSKTRNEVLQEERATLYEAFVALSATGGFNIVQVAGDTRTTWGPGTDFATVAGGVNEQPAADFQRGSIAVSETEFTVPADGLYHIAFDTEVGKAVIVPVNSWGIIGGATPNGWSGDTELASSGFSTESITFSATDVALTPGDYKFRYGGGWKVELDTLIDLGDGNTGIKINANFGGTLDDLVPGGDNISNTDPGLYTVNVNWASGTGYTAELIKTEDLDPVDYSSTEMGLIGNGLTVDGEAQSWEAPYGLSTPTVNGNIYTWSWSNVGTLIVEDGPGFKIREGDDWTGDQIAYPTSTVSGSGAADFGTNGDGNFVPSVEANYNITLERNGLTQQSEVIIEKL